MRDFGGMVSFQLESEAEAVDFVARTTIFQLAESLGGVESLIEHPARMTHASTADAPFAPPGNLVRLSVGMLGCRRRGAKLRIEIWDTGLGHPPKGNFAQSSGNSIRSIIPLAS